MQKVVRREPRRDENLALSNARKDVERGSPGPERCRRRAVAHGPSEHDRRAIAGTRSAGESGAAALTLGGMLAATALGLGAAAVHAG